MKRFFFSLLLISIFTIQYCSAQPLNRKDGYTKQDTLRGSITPERAWWDVVKYDITVKPEYEKRSIEGSVGLQFKVLNSGKRMQIDLQSPMEIVAATWDSNKLQTERLGNVYYINFPNNLEKGKTETVNISYKGIPRPALNAPWDGGWIWSKDAKGRPWISVAVQGLGASAWYPCKDHQSDEPDNGAKFSIIVPDTLVAVANGKLKTQSKNNGLVTYTWEVINPINNYNIVPYIGKYVNWQETYNGEKGALNLSYWVLDYNLEKAKKQFTQVPQTLKALEHWFGPYPFYEDDFKLVEAPHLGMEHQSAVAYGNRFQNGYRGTDLSGTGWGLKWDYIIVHETGHEWFGNNITSKDIADMWVHEGFTDYSETLFVEYYYGKDAADQYVRGLRNNIENNKPIIGDYGVNQEGSGDMYYKGANLVHTIRQIINDDERFRSILRGLNKNFYHQTVTTKQIEEYIIKESGKDVSKVFDQYLRNKDIPTLKLDIDGNKIKYKWDNAIDGFNMPVLLTNNQWIYPTTKEQEKQMQVSKDINVHPDFYINVKVDD